MKRKLISFLLAAVLMVGLGATAAADAEKTEASSSQYTFSYHGETYTVGLQEWENGYPMPMEFGEEYTSGGMRGTDDDFELEYVVCIKTGEQGAEHPASNDIFAKIDSVTYMADVRYQPESSGNLVMGAAADVTRDLSDGTGSIQTKAFSISVPGTAYFSMDITAVITLKLDDTDVTLTQKMNFQKPSTFIGMTTLRLDNYMDECDTTAKLQEIIKDRKSLWRFYAEKSGFQNADELQKLAYAALTVYLPAGAYGDLSINISDQMAGAADLLETQDNRLVSMTGPIILLGSEKENGTALGSLTYEGKDGVMSGVADIKFDAALTGKNYGFLVAGVETGTEGETLWCDASVSRCSFDGYRTAVSSEKNGYANLYECTFSNNDIAVSINCGDGANANGDITNCTFIQNKTAVYLQSLGKSCSPYSFRVTMCNFLGNDTEVNYQPAGTFYLFNNYFETIDGTLKQKATVVEGKDTVIKQGIWRDQPFQSDVTGYGVADGGVVVNHDDKTLNSDYLESVSFDVIAADDENGDIVGTWAFD